MMAVIAPTAYMVEIEEFLVLGSWMPWASYPTREEAEDEARKVKALLFVQNVRIMKVYEPQKAGA